MCGITVVRSISSSAIQPSFDKLAKQLKASIATINHRGPDSSGIYVSNDNRLGIGHARLSIIDLESGQQPLHDKDQLVHAVVNGEFYDYDRIREDLVQRGCHFQSRVDSELVIHLYKVYGQNFIHHLRGDSLFDGKLMIASEMKAFVPLGWKPEWDIESIVQMGDYNDNRTVFKGVRREDVDEGPIAKRMAESIGATVHMVMPTEEDLVCAFQKVVYHAEQPVASFHGARKLILSEHYRRHGYKVTLSGEGSDESFGGYAFLAPDFLRARDFTADALDIKQPDDAERVAALAEYETGHPPQDHASLAEMSLSDSQVGRSMLGGISTHRNFASLGLDDSIFSAAALNQVPLRDRCLTVAEGLSPVARDKMSSGQWHPLHSALYAWTKTGLTNHLLNSIGDR
ncbi:hypothetical protein MPER_12605 [Moniliophthora perniciosa FA553]|nr:hypothetical protein MPER_12605 [Moniliophthora perniciosa FA553]